MKKLLAIIFIMSCVNSMAQYPNIYKTLVLGKQEGDKIGFVDCQNNWIIEPQYDDCALGFHDEWGNFNEYSYVCLDGKWGIIDILNQTIAPFKWNSYDEIVDEFNRRSKFTHYEDYEIEELAPVIRKREAGDYNEIVSRLLNAEEKTKQVKR